MNVKGFLSMTLGQDITTHKGTKIQAATETPGLIPKNPAAYNFHCIDTIQQEFQTPSQYNAL